MTEKIPATIITGFLGAGKTSLIRHLVENNGGRRFALIINEFGDLGVDRELLTGCGMEGCSGEDVVELANGCICCTVADDFLPAIEAILARPNRPDHIVIETSGLALPKPLVKAFAWPEVRTRTTVDGVITVIDAAAVSEGRFADDHDAVQDQRMADESLDHESPLEELFEEQLQCADMVVLNKTDLLDSAGLAKIHETVAPFLRSAVKTVTSVHGRLGTHVLLGLDAAAEDDLDSRHSHHDDGHDHDHEAFDSFVMPLGVIEDAKALDERIIAAVESHDILRVKGFLDIPGKPMRQVIQGVGPRIQRYFDRDWRAGEIRASRLVVIGHHGLDRHAITSAIAG